MALDHHTFRRDASDNFIRVPDDHTSFTAGPVEELIWRGYAIPRLIEKYHGINLGVLISSITWAFYHIGPFHIGITLLLGIIYGYIFIKIRRLTPLIYGHILFDVISFILPQTLTLLV